MLLFTAALFGLAFIFQHHAAQQTSTLWFMFWRFLLAALTLAVCWFISHLYRPRPYGKWLGDGLICGAFMFAGMYLQQQGLAITTVGKSGFLTGLYVVLIPIFSIAIGRHPSKLLSLAIGCACIGLFFFANIKSTQNSEFRWNLGDTLTLIGASCWALQVLWMERAVRHASVLAFSVAQIATVAVLTLLLALFSGQTSDLWRSDWMQYGFWDIFVTGVGSSALALFLQAVGQRRIPAAHAAVILSLESVFALFFGWLFLDEIVSRRMLLGAAFLFAAMLIAQFDDLLSKKHKKPAN